MVKGEIKMIRKIINFFHNVYNYFFHYTYIIQFMYLPEHEMYECYVFAGHPIGWTTISTKHKKKKDAEIDLELIKKTHLFRKWRIIRDYKV
jgi:hypothetical protein